MNLELMKTLTTMDQTQLYSILNKFLESEGYTNILKSEHYILAEGELPICLIAHIDTVFSHIQRRKNFIYDKEQSILWGIGGSGFDDRAGCYAIIELVQRGYHPYILFTDLEESGGIGSSELIVKYPKFPFKDCKCLIQLDRANEKDSVYYSCDNKEFEKYINSFGFETEWGSFSDISILAPAWKIAAVNLSVGYCNEHTSNELLHTDWLDKTINKVEQILLNSKKMKKYKYIPFVNQYDNYNYLGKITPTWHNNNICLICGIPLNKDNCYPIFDEDFPYCVCSSCYNQYYVTDNNLF